MEKFKNALKSVNKFGILAIALVAFATMAFTPAKNLAVKKWGYNPSTSQWVEITGLEQSDRENTRDYKCTSSLNNCSAEFDASQNPNIDASSPQNIVPGTFAFE
ncbi:hypothetical protein AY601_2942 [Pedobacter cryoconitis]|uniref:Uncharacterized protein n=1 Tax=Pedobacter cryoconitis TaxID=188932 RepID=A0A127VEQ9_9SPHI|nr:hypothetical protein [Pedobacter cryoconitis]AMP99816.1 hypothetical protein AY601_2942 [Pedobacter cryoconitis]